MKKKNLMIWGSIILVLVLIGVAFILLKGDVSKAEALDIAFDYLGKSQSDFSYTKVSKDTDDNLYEVELTDDTYKYEIDVNMTSGKVMDFEKELINNVPENNDTNNQTSTSKKDNNKKTTTKKTSSNEKYITADEAKKIAISHAKVKKSDVVFENVNRELDDGKMVYEVDFIYNNKEYDYEIDAKSGKIIKHEVDMR